MLKLGELAPPFAVLAADGRMIRLEEMRAPVVLYFFFKAFTPNCVVETKGFRDNYPELKMLGFEVIGVSTDSMETQCRFATVHGVPFPMIGDHSGALTRLYDVKWPLLPFARRVTYVLDEQHAIIGAFHHEFQANPHLDGVLRLARRWKSEKVAAQSV